MIINEVPNQVMIWVDGVRVILHHFFIEVDDASMVNDVPVPARSRLCLADHPLGIISFIGVEPNRLTAIFADLLGIAHQAMRV